MKHKINKQKCYLRKYTAISMAVSMCAMLSACGGLGGVGYTVTTRYDYDGEGGLRDILEHQVSSGDYVSVSSSVDYMNVYGKAIAPSAQDVLLKGNGSNRLPGDLSRTIAPAINGDTQYVNSGKLSASANTSARNAKKERITRIRGGEHGVFYWSSASGNNFSMQKIHVLDVDRKEVLDIVGGVIGTKGSASAKVGDMKDTLFTDIKITASGSSSEITGGVIGAYSTGRNAYIGNIERSLFHEIDIYSKRDTINGGAIGAEGDKATIGRINQSQFSSFTIDSGYRVIGGAIGAIGNDRNEYSKIGSINNSLFVDFDVSASDFIVGGAVGMAATGPTEQTNINSSVFANLNVRGKHITGGAIGLRSDDRSTTLNTINKSYFGNISSHSTTDLIGGAIGLNAGGGPSDYVKATLGGIHNSTIDRVSASADRNVYGGAIGVYANRGIAVIGSINNSVVSNNTARSSSSSAYGGGLYATGLANALEIRNSSFTGNKASSAANAYGGAIFVDTRAANSGRAHTLNLVADSGKKTIFQNNTVVDRAGTRSNAIHFGATTGNNAENAVLNIQTASGGEVALYDPVTVAMNNGKSFTLNKTGAGTFFWDGLNTFNALGGSNVNLQGGTTILGNSFSLNSSGSNLQVEADSGSSLEFMGNRNSNTAMFDFSGSSGSSFSADNSVRFGVSSRQLTDVNGTFLVATGLSDYSGFTPQSNGSVVSYDRTTPGELKVTVNYVSSYRAAIARSANTTQAQYALNHLVSDTTKVSDRDFDAIAGNLSDATAEHGMTQAMAALDIHQAVLHSVKQLAYTELQRQQFLAAKLGYHAGADSAKMTPESAFSGLAQISDQNTLRVWGGDIGDVSKAGSYNSYQGYKTDLNGSILGTSYQLTPQLNMGTYAAYTDGKTRLHNQNASVTTDSYHYGLTGSYAFTPKLTLQGDIGGAHYGNEGQRCLGQVCSQGDFEQNLYTAGGELSYLFDVSDVALRPFGGLRYTSIRQTGFTEQGGVTSSSVNGFGLTSVSSSLGLSASKVFALKQGFVVPEFSLTWRHEWADRQASSSSYYTQHSGQRFGLDSYKNDRDFADLRLGVSNVYRFGANKSLSTFINYQLGLSEHTNNHALNAGLLLQF